MPVYAGEPRTLGKKLPMKAAVLHALGEAPRFEDFPEPTPQADEVLVEVTAAPLTALDRFIAAGTHYSKPAQWPHGCGVNGIGRLPDGSRVLFGGLRAPFGAMAERAAVNPKLCFPIPADADDAQVAAAFNPGLSAWLTLQWRAKLMIGERVLILGATGVTGQFAVQFARRLGAGPIVVAGRNKKILAELRALGAHASIALDQSDAQLEAAFKAEAGDGYDVVIDYLWGHPAEVLLRTLAVHDLTTRPKRIRFVQVGEQAGSHISLPAGLLRSTALEILGNGTGNSPPLDVMQRALPELIRSLSKGELRMDFERIPLSQVAERWKTEQQGRRPVFVP